MFVSDICMVLNAPWTGPSCSFTSSPLLLPHSAFSCAFAALLLLNSDTAAAAGAAAFSSGRKFPVSCLPTCKSRAKAMPPNYLINFSRTADQKRNASSNYEYFIQNRKLTHWAEISCWQRWKFVFANSLQTKLVLHRDFVVVLPKIRFALLDYRVIMRRRKLSQFADAAIYTEIGEKFSSRLSKSHLEKGWVSLVLVSLFWLLREKR